MKIGIVLPVHNEDKKIKSVLTDLAKLNLPLIIVDDGSWDSTRKILQEFKKENSKIILLNHKINLGKGAALKTGCEAAFSSGFEAIIMMDSDGQHSVDDVKLFLDDKKFEKYDVILGSRNLTTNAPIIRLLGNKFASVLVSVLFGVYISDLLCGFRGLTKKGYGKVKWESRGYGVETEMVVKMAKYKLNFCEVPIQSIYFDKTKGVTILDSISILFDVFRWRLSL